MRKIFLIPLLMLIMPQNLLAYLNRDSAIVRVINKDAGKVQEITVPVGQETRFEKLFINIRTCKQTDPFQPEDFFAFVEISEAEKGLIFSNWMSRNEPGQNPLQHPDYDLWLVQCK